MARIKQHYGITGAVEFLDVEILKDNRLYVDPRAIRLQKGQFADAANRCTTTFFNEVTACVVSRNQADQARGLALLQRFTEPKETRLGMSKTGINGHGGSAVIGQAIWDALRTDLNAFVNVGVLKLIEDLPVFVEDFANDRTSDLVTRVVFDPLAQFTASMVARHPEFTGGEHVTKTFSRQVWDPTKKKWTQKDLDLPVAAGKPLLLVPRDWARHSLLMTSGRYYGTTMLTFAQEQRTVIDPKTGKALKPPKDDLRKSGEFQRGVETIVRVTSEAHGAGEDLMDRFRHFVDTRYEPVSDEMIAKRTS